MCLFVFRTRPLAIAMLAAAAMAGSSAAQPEKPDESLIIAAKRTTPYTLGEIKIVRNGIFDDESAVAGLGRWINATHWTTQEAVIQREIWRSPGEKIDEAFAEELERNFRALGLFADVTVKLVPSRDPEAAADVRDLHVFTRDRLSLGGGAGASFVGAAASGNASLSESNVFGMGDRLRFSYRENDFGESQGNITYFDRYVAGTWTSATLQAGRREEGNAFALTFDRPFRFLRDKMAWNISASTTAVDQDYFAFNETIAEVPYDVSRLSASVRWRYGSRMNFWTRGLAARYFDFEYFGARGVAASAVRVPGNTESLFAGATLGWTKLRSFREVTYLDTLEFVQDVQLGTRAFFEAGAVYRNEQTGGQSQTNPGEAVQPLVRANLDETLALGESRYASASLNGYARLDDGDAPGWRADVNLRAFDLSFQPHTLGLAVTYTEVEETENLPIQLTLGESNGLRGYPNRELTGQRLLSLSFEDRINLGLRISSFDLGAVIFGDAAWIGARGSDLEGPFTSAGVGLRVGSTKLLGRNVLRVDFSVPFDDVNGQSFDPLISLTLGQTFSL